MNFPFLFRIFPHGTRSFTEYRILGVVALPIIFWLSVHFHAVFAFVYASFFRTRNVSFNLSRFSNRSEWRGKWFSIENTNKKLRNMNHWKCFYDAIWRLTARLLVIRKLLGNCWIIFRLFVFFLNELNGIYLKTSDYINNKMSSFIYFSLNFLNSWGD